MTEIVSCPKVESQTLRIFSATSQIKCYYPLCITLIIEPCKAVVSIKNRSTSNVRNVLYKICYN